MPSPDFVPLIHGDHERFGPARAQVRVWAAGGDRVELSLDRRDFILDPLSIDDLAQWLVHVLKPSVENINASEEDADAAG